MMVIDADFDRRFGGVKRLYGEAGLNKLRACHVAVIGIGGVGTWVAEALARNAVGQITLIDLDNIAESNVNRQLHALDGTFGKAKVTAMAERIKLINPWCDVAEIEEFVTVENTVELLGRGYHGVVDAIDDARAKASIAAYCRENKLPFVMTGGAGGRLDPTRIQQTDLARTSGDRLLAKVRTTLRRDYGFPKEPPKSTKTSTKFGIPCIYSDEPVIRPENVACDTEEQAITGLNCAGYGSSVCVTASFGMAAASAMLNQLLKS